MSVFHYIMEDILEAEIYGINCARLIT